MNIESQSPSSEPDLLCGACGYNLRGVPSTRCPECGREFHPNHLTSNLIPWEQRKYIGRLRAFWRTAWMASLRPRELAEKMQWPVDRRAGKWFRFWVLLFAGAVLMGVPLLLPRIWPEMDMNRYPQDDFTKLLINPMTLYVSACAVAIWLALASALIGAFFHPSHLPVERQNRAIALSHYAVAPLFFGALALCVGVSLAALISPSEWSRIPSAQGWIFSQLVGATAVLLSVVWWTRGLVRKRPRASGALALGSLLIGAAGAAGMTSAIYQKVVAPYAGALLAELGIAMTTAVPLLWWWIHSARLTRLCFGYSAAQTARVAAGLLVLWISSFVLVLATAYTGCWITMLIIAR